MAQVYLWVTAYTPPLNLSKTRTCNLQMVQVTGRSAGCAGTGKGATCYDWLSSKIREEAYETSKGIDEHLCSVSGAGLDS